MIPITPLALEAFRYSHTKSCLINVFNGDQLVSDPNDPIIVSDGSITADRYQKARRSLDCTIPLTQWKDIPALDVLQSRLQVWLGYDLGGHSELLTAGVFRINELARTSSGELSVSATSLESYVIDNELLDESEWAKTGDICLDAIQRLITACFPVGSPPRFDITPEAQAMSGVQLTTDLAVGSRWDLIESYAFAIDCDVYCAPSGEFRIARSPDIEAGKPVWRINEGPDGVLVSMNTRVSRDKVYNGVQVIAQSSNSDVPPVSGDVITVADIPGLTQAERDALKVYEWGGLFGKRPLVFTDPSDELKTKADCNAKALVLLKEMLAEERTLDLSAIPNPAMEPDDIIEILRYHPISGVAEIEKHMIASMSIPLGLGEWSAQTLSNRTSEDLNDESPLKPPKDT